ncbi:MAG: alpha/beta hydrolase [Hyphomicrobiales bacterium]|nr:alpha/beta hydrolase [Hyphomicrobiales bacterium]
MSDAFIHHFSFAPDGLRLYWREYGAGHASTPVVCLPGLTRTTEDFDVLARRLARDGRRVLVLDYRGRGLSDFDKDWTRYNLQTEGADILAVLRAANVARAIFIGTSRGGLHIMGLAAVVPHMLAGAVLNDVGPVVETAGLLRIKSYVGKWPTPRDWHEAVAVLKRTMSAQFPGLDHAQWETYARMTFAEREGALTIRYDPALMKTLDAITPDMPPIELWPLYDALKQTPLMILRGENSDLLSEKTLAEMAMRRPDARLYKAPGEGHAPLLIDAAAIDAIAGFVRGIKGE